MRFFRVTALWILLLPLAVGLAGAASNQAVLFANGDKFPVMWNPAKLAANGAKPDGMIDDTHCAMTADTHLNILGDIIDLHSASLSIGDLMIDLGEWMWSFCPFVWAFVVITKLRHADLRTNNW